MRGLILAGLALATATGMAWAQDGEYVDDRSSATSVITSFYNAINAGEYARAYGYFGEGAEVAAFEQFKAGYADTASVVLQMGEETSEGAAGSTYYSLPVAIDAEGKDGSHKIFAGCYYLRLVQPMLQEEPPFSPLHIVEGRLKPAKGALETLVAATCPDP